MQQLEDHLCILVSFPSKPSHNPTYNHENKCDETEYPTLTSKSQNSGKSVLSTTGNLLFDSV